MDMFKLLTRSTKLQKAPANKRDGIPSAGTAPIAVDQNIGHETRDPALIPRGQKRKRSPSLDAKNDKGGRVFSNASGGAEPNDGRSKLDFTGGESTCTMNDDSEAYGKLPHREDECRRILHKNKIKVSILGGSVEAQAQQKTLVKIPKIRKPTSKNDKLQLYPEPLTSFSELRSKYSISRRLDENIRAQGYREPTEVQIGCLPLLLGSDKERGLPKGHHKTREHHPSELDLLTIAPTGSGKTLAFLVPTLQCLLDERHREKRTASNLTESESTVRAIVLAPSHELVEQIVNEGRKLARDTGIQISALKKRMKLHEVISDSHGDDHDPTEDGEGHHLAKPNSLVKSDIVVSTPPLFFHAISSGVGIPPKPLPSVCRLVLDEADILLDRLFREQTVGIWNACVNPSLRTSLWSATINSSIESFTTDFILDRRKTLDGEIPKSSHHVLRLVVGLKDSSIPHIDHRLMYAASEQGKLLALRQLLHPATASSLDAASLQPPFLVFTQTIPRAVALHSELLYDISPEAGGSSRIAVLHSELSETARSNIMAGVRKGEIWVLITTDLLSRGVDFRGMNGVVSYDIPNTSASYIHRAGRTGRQGREGGIAITLYTKEDIPYVKNVANVIAVSEKTRAASKSGLPSNRGGDLQQWLLDSLPDVSKKTKQRLKQGGIEHRKSRVAGDDPKRAKKMQISTKSGYDRKIENRRRGAARSSQSDRVEYDDDNANSEAGEWEGFD